MSEFRAIPRELLERHIAEKNQPNRDSAQTGRSAPETVITPEQQSKRLQRGPQLTPGGPATGGMVDHNMWALEEVKRRHASRTAVNERVDRTEKTDRATSNNARAALENYEKRAAGRDYGELKKAHVEVQKDLGRKQGKGIEI